MAKLPPTRRRCGGRSAGREGDDVVQEHVRLRPRLATLLLASSMLAAPAFAQTAPPPPAPAPTAQEGVALAEVVVTAQKREENLQKVPISIQALSGQLLEQHQVESFDDYAKLLPSVSFQSFGPGQSQLYFRGISTGGDGLHAGPLPTSGLYIDETPVTTIGSALDLHVYDMARAEALSGPQGTLYGASSLSGTLRLITNKPDTHKFEAGYDLQGDAYGKGDGGGQVEGFVNVPVNDKVAVRLVGFYTHDGGFIDNTPGTRTYQRPHTTGYDDDGNPIVANSPLTINNAAFAKKDQNDITTYGGRAALKVDLNENWTVTPGIIYQNQISHGAFLYDPAVGDLAVHDFTPDRTKDHWYLASLLVQGRISNWDVTYNGSYLDRTVDNISDYSYFNVAYDTYTDYNYLQDAAGHDIDPTQRIIQNDRYTKTSHELRVSSPAHERLRATAGLFMQRQTDDQLYDYIVPGLRNAVDAFSPPVPGTNSDDVYYTNIHRVDRDYAVFTEASFDILSNLTLTAGVRGFYAKNTLDGFSGGASAVTRQTTCLAQTVLACPDIDKKYEEGGETHKVNLTWQIDPARLVYFTYSTGFRPGGNNRDAYALGKTQTIPPFVADTLTNYEVGAKTSWLDRTLRVNGALFWEDWDNVQYSEPGILGIYYTVNAGAARSRGVEGDASWVIKRHLTLSATGTYVDAALSQPFCAQSGCDPATGGQLLAPEGTRLPVQPRFKINSTARYDFDIGDYHSFVQGTIAHQSDSTSFLTTAGEAVLGPTKGFTTFDFSAGASFRNMTFSVFVQNAFDERGILSKNTVCTPGICGAYARLYPTKPQFFGIRFGQHF